MSAAQRVSQQYIDYLDSMDPRFFKSSHRITKKEFETLIQDCKNAAEYYDVPSDLMEMRLSVALRMFSGARATDLSDIYKISKRQILYTAQTVADLILIQGQKTVGCPDAPKKVIRGAQKFFDQFEEKMALMDLLIQCKEWDAASALALDELYPAIEKLLEEPDLPEKYRAQLEREL